MREQFSILAEQKGLSYTCACDVKESFVADEFLLQRCISNLIQNAVKYTDKGGEIQYHLYERKDKAAGDSVVIEVKNTGTLSKETMAHVFDRLYRGDKSRTDGGSGLGLSIAKAIMNLHQGTINIDCKNNFVILTVSFPFSTIVPDIKKPE